MARFLPQSLTLQSAVVGQPINHSVLHRVIFISTSSPEQSLGVNDVGQVYMANVPAYASNALAISAGLVVGTIYRQNDLLAIVH
jgi:hypothetical protein